MKLLRCVIFLIPLFFLPDRRKEGMSCRTFQFVLGVILVLGVSHGAFARDDLVPGSRYTSARGAAMGDANLGLGEDGATGLFVNPATIGKIRDMQVEPLNFSLTGNSGFAQMFSYDFYKVISLSSYLPNLMKRPGEFCGTGYHLLPAAYMRGFAFGMLLQAQRGASAGADGSVRNRSSYQFIPSVGTAIRLAGGIVRIGYSLQWVNRAAGAFDLPPGTTPLEYNEGLLVGSGLSHNVGFSLTLPITYLPSLNFVMRNAFSLSFQEFSLIKFANNSSGVLATEPTSYDASIGIQPRFASGMYANISLELRDLTNTSQMSIWGRAVAGVELSLKELFFIRGGWGSGYPALGIGLRRPKGEFGLSWYSEELGAAYHALRDSRFMAQFQVRAF